MINEMQDIAAVLCRTAINSLEDVIEHHIDALPVYLFFVAEACYVRYNNLEQKIDKISIVMIDKAGVVIEIDPFACNIKSIVAENSIRVYNLNKYTANILVACVNTIWKSALEYASLISIGNDRYITANLLECF